MKKLLFALCILICGMAHAQSAGPTNLTGTQCLSLNVFTATNLVITITGSFNGILQPQIFTNSAQPTTVIPLGSTTSQPNISQSGIYTTSVSAPNNFQVCAQNISGTATVTFSTPQYFTTATGTITGNQCVSLNIYIPGLANVVVTGSWAGALQPFVYLGPPQPGTVSLIGVSAPQATIIGDGTYTTYITTPNVWQICGISVSGTATVVMTSAGPAAPASGLTLETNGVLNGSQTLLNLIGSGATTITQDGAGNVTVSSTGGGAGNPASPFGSLQGNNAGSFGGIPLTTANFSTGQTRITNFSNVLYAPDPSIVTTGGFNWQQSPSGTLTGGSAATVTLTPCPLGINGLDYWNTFLISDYTTAAFANGSASITATNSYFAGESVRFLTTGTLPFNFSTTAIYYVLSAGLSGSTFQVAAIPFGTAIVAGSAGSGTQTAIDWETPQITFGGTCASGASSGTVLFTPIYSHAAGYTIGTATAGIYETLANAAQPQTGGSTFSTNYRIVLGPAGNPNNNGQTGPTVYPIFGTLRVGFYNLTIDEYGSVLQCWTRNYCTDYNRLSGSQNKLNLLGPTMVSMQNLNGWPIASTQCSGGVVTINTTVPHAIQVGDIVDVLRTDNAFYWGGSATWGFAYDGRTVSAVTSTSVSYPINGSCPAGTSLANTPGYINVINAPIMSTQNGMHVADFQGFLAGAAYMGTQGHWNEGPTLLNDQDFVLDRSTDILLTSGQVTPSTCSSTYPYCGFKIYAPGPGSRNSSIPHLYNLDFNVACTGNGIANFAGNTMDVTGANLQSVNQVAVVSGNPLSGFGPTTLLNVYAEAGGCTNPDVGLIANAGIINYGTPITIIGGEGPGGGLITLATGGSTVYAYYIQAVDSVAGVSAPLLFGEAAPSGSTVNVQFPRMQPLPGDTITYNVIRTTDLHNAPTTSACIGGSTNVCGSVTTGMAQCSGLWCSFTDTVTSATSAITITSPAPFLPSATFWPAGWVMEGNGVAYAVGITNQGCAEATLSFSGNSSPACFSANDPNSGSLTSWGSSVQGARTALMLEDINQILPPIRGRLNFLYPTTTYKYPQSIITLADSSPDVTQANIGHRPSASASDTAIDLDCLNYVTLQCLGFRSPVSISQYINAVPNAVGVGNSTNWLHQLTASLETSRVSNLFTQSVTVLGPCIGFLFCGPFSPTNQVSDTFVRANSGTLGANWTCSSNGTWGITSNTATPLTLTSGTVLNCAYTATSFTNDQVSQVTFIAPSTDGIGATCRTASGASTGYTLLLDGLGDSRILKSVAGVASNLATGGPAFAIGDVATIACVGTTITAYKNGTQILSATDSAITSGSPGMTYFNNPAAGSGALSNFIGGNASWNSSQGLSIQSNPIPGQEGSPTLNTAVCWKTAGTTPTLGYCSTALSGTPPVCTCN
jgi:hypothetical protein